MNSDSVNSTALFVDPSDSPLEKQPFGRVGILVGWALRSIGVVGNCIIWDATHSLKQPGGTMIWVKHMAFWHILYLMRRIILDATRYIFTLDLEDVSRLTCKAFGFLEIYLLFTAYFISSCAHMDGALLLSLPTWYSRQNWSTIILKSSACVAIITFLCCSPSIVVFDIQNGSCEIVSQTRLFLTYTLVFFSFFIYVSAIHIGFIVGLRRYRMKKNKPNRTKVEFSSSKEEKEEVRSAGNKNISINTARTEKFKFSAEDMKAVKHSFIYMTTPLIQTMLFVTGFYGIKLVNETLGKDINFWAYFELYLVYTLGVQFFILFLSRDKLRSCLRERWSGIFRK